jgi:hypothetical protein
MTRSFAGALVGISVAERRRSGRDGREATMEHERSKDTPEVPGLAAVFRHLDEVPWQQVKTQMHPDGQRSVWEKWLAFRRDPAYLSLYARYDPGMVVRRHGHYSNHIVFVLRGELACGERRCPAGTHIELPLGAAFGPFVAGPEGADLFEVMMGDPRSWGADEAGFERLLRERGIEKLPDPPIELPDWLEDRRGS